MIELSVRDYDLVFTCRQLLHNQTFLSDLLTEKLALDCMAKALSSHEQIATDGEILWLVKQTPLMANKILVSRTGKAALLRVNDKLQVVEEALSRLARTPQVPEAGAGRNSNNAEETTLRRSETADGSAVHEVKEEGLSGYLNEFHGRC